MAVSRNNSLLSMNMRGAEGLAQALRDLGDDRGVKRILKKALLEESRPAAAEARRLAPKDTGNMADKIDVSTTLSRRQRRGRRRMKGKKDLTAEVFIGAGAKGPAVLNEFGTAPRYQKKTGRFTGATPAQPFLRPAWEKWKFTILDRFALRLWYEIEKAAERLRRKQMRKLKEGSRKR